MSLANAASVSSRSCRSAGVMPKRTPPGRSQPRPKRLPHTRIVALMIAVRSRP
jgi:hypothetical protein